MPRLFSYGTPQDPDVQQAIFGRRLEGQPDVLPGYARTLILLTDPAFAETSGSAEHVIVRLTGDAADRVTGTTLEITDAELAHADVYESAPYRHQSALLASRRRAWVYVDARARLRDT